MPNDHRRPMSPETRSSLGGLEVLVRRGTVHMATIGRRGSVGLDRRIAADAGIPDDLTPAEYALRLAAARRAYFIRLSRKAADARSGRART